MSRPPHSAVFLMRLLSDATNRDKSLCQGFKKILFSYLRAQRKNKRDPEVRKRREKFVKYGSISVVFNSTEILPVLLIVLGLHLCLFREVSL